jgi:hypothetical protein
MAPSGAEWDVAKIFDRLKFAKDCYNKLIRQCLEGHGWTVTDSNKGNRRLFDQFQCSISYCIDMCNERSFETQKQQKRMLKRKDRWSPGSDVDFAGGDFAGGEFCRPLSRFKICSRILHSIWSYYDLNYAFNITIRTYGLLKKDDRNAGH